MVSDALRSAALKPHAAGLRARRLPAISISAAPIAEDAAAIWASRLGGRPDLPAEVAWPTATRRKDGVAIELPLAFVCQLALAEVGKLDSKKLLQRAGLLSFFVLDLGRLSAAVGWNPDDVEARDRTRVLCSPAGAALVRRDPPAGVPASHRAPTMKPSFRKAETWPLVEGNAISPHGRSVDGTVVLDKDAWQAWAEAELRNPAAQLLGHPAGCEYPIGRSPDQRLLLSLETEASGLPWELAGRNGFLFFAIPEPALRAGDWTQASHKEW